MDLKKILEKKEYEGTGSENKQLENYVEEHPRVNFVEFRGHMLVEGEYGLLKEMEEVFGEEAVIYGDQRVDFPYFQIKIENGNITYVSFELGGLEEIPEQIGRLEELQELSIFACTIRRIENLPDNLGELYLKLNRIKKVENIPESVKLLNLKLNSLIYHPIKNRREIKRLRKKGVNVII